MFKVVTGMFSYIFFLFGYISSNNIFPEKLSKTEEEYYINKYLAGDIDAKNKLIEHNLRLVAHIAKKYTNNKEEIEDYISIGSIGLIKAVNSFKESKGYKLSTYAAKCIENEILMNIRKNKKCVSDMSLNNIIAADKDGNNLELEDIIDISKEDAIDTIYNRHLVKQSIMYINKKLPKREKEIMLLRLGLKDGRGYTQQEVAEKLGISRSYVSRIETKVQKLLSDEIKF